RVMCPISPFIDTVMRHVPFHKPSLQGTPGGFLIPEVRPYITPIKLLLKNGAPFLIVFVLGSTPNWLQVAYSTRASMFRTVVWQLL
ncbi:MAG TPA: hypothetical protein VEI53_04920, partial [Ktedonobacteraceae bacterium]|nr:hypothetical protein [Ktedonobacteraceae bacterium]